MAIHLVPTIQTLFCVNTLFQGLLFYGEVVTRDAVMRSSKSGQVGWVEKEESSAKEQNKLVLG